MSQIKYFFILTLFILTHAQTLFPYTPLANIYTGVSGGQVITASIDQNLIIIGYQGGIIKTYNLQGNLLNTMLTGTSAAIIQLQPVWAGPALGNAFYSLDNNNTVQLWLVNGTRQYSLEYAQTVYNIALTKINQGSFYYTLNYGSTVKQLIWNLTGGYSQLKNYPPSSGSLFTTVKYSADSLYLVTGSNTSYVNVYNSSNGNLLGYNFSTGSSVSKFSYLSSGTMALVTNNFDVYSFTQPTFSNSNIGKTTSTVFTGCPSGLIISGQVNSNHLNVFSTNGNKLQTLSYPTSNVVSLYCSNNYLISLDSSGYLAINKLPLMSDDNKFPNWAIGLLGGVGGIVIIIVIVIIVVCIRRKKNNEMSNISNKQMLGGYKQEVII